MHLDQSGPASGHHAILILNRRPVRSGADLINYPRVKYKYNKNRLRYENNLIHVNLVLATEIVISA